jgi:NDP-sugar pyrophosphorylase family protein
MNNKTIEAVILAGGRGQRMGELTNDRQKCLLPVDGEPILGIIISNLVSAFGSVDVKVAVSYHANDVMQFINNRFGSSRKLIFSYIPHRFGAGTLGAYKTMVGKVRGTFIGLPGDVIATPRAYREVVEDNTKNMSSLTLTVTARRDFADSHGVVIGENGNVEKLLWPISEDQIPESSYRDVNIYTMELGIMSMLERYPTLTGAFTQFIQQTLLSYSKIKPKYYLTTENVLHYAYPKDLQLPLAV